MLAAPPFWLSCSGLLFATPQRMPTAREFRMLTSTPSAAAPRPRRDTTTAAASATATRSAAALDSCSALGDGAVGDEPQEELLAQDELLDDPNAMPSDPLRRMTLAAPEQAGPPILYEGFFFKKRVATSKFMRGQRLLQGAMSAVPSLEGRLGWARRFVRVFPGKIEWYTDDQPTALAKPAGFAPLVPQLVFLEGDVYFPLMESLRDAQLPKVVLVHVQQQ